MEYIVVQAGGKGTRLEYLTKNKPKALVPVNNLPMLFHLFRKYPDKKFIIIGDYKKEVLKKYLNAFAKVDFEVVDAIGTGTCGGLKAACDRIPNNKSFMLIWSDLILSNDFSVPEDDENYVGISMEFPCRWSYKDNVFFEEKSYENGVAGLFIFKDKSILKDVPDSGEFVKWLSEKKYIFKRLELHGTCEFGTLEEYNKLEVDKCRPFNKITIENDMLIKEAIDEQGKELATKEINWYKKVKELEFNEVPKIYSFEPLKMELIKGKNIHECINLPLEDKKEVLLNIIKMINNLHNLSSCEIDEKSIEDTYITKTFDRLSKIQELVPFAKDEFIVVNGVKCKNVFFYEKELIEKLRNIKVNKFSLIHGDCTFSNMLLREDNTPVLIYPRGYFGETKLYGDPNYDWAKIYYSLVGDYDRFNLKEFKLSINEDSVDLKIESNNWKELEDMFFDNIEVNQQTIKLLHAVIWLSLTTYAWQDYDSICAAFYNGLLYLEEVL